VTAIGIVRQKNRNAFATFKEYLFVSKTHLHCTFNILRKFATVRRRASKITVFSSIIWIKALQSSRRRGTTRNNGGD